MKVSAIVAMSKNRVIGLEGDIPWRLSADLKYFKKKTIHRHVIMGRKTFLSIGKPLPKRVNIVLTRDPFFLAKDVLVAHSIDDAMAIAHDNQEVEVFIIGGGEIYEQSMKYWDRIYITVVDVTLEGDAFFPALNEQEWELVSEKQHQADEKNDYDYCFQVFERIAGQSSDS